MKLHHLALAVNLLVFACDRDGPGDQYDRSSAASSHADQAEHESKHEAHEPGHAEHGHEEPSDLDRPVSELFEASCEHGTKAYECDECRYEVGVVRVPDKLVDEGLVEVVEVAKQVPKTALTLTGEVQLDETRVVHVSSRAPGIIRKVFVQPGQKVKKGERLLQVDSSLVGDAQGEFLEARAAEELAQKNLDRLTALRAENITSDKALQTAQQEHEITKIRAQVAQARLGRLGAGASAGGGRIDIRAPRTGRVIEMHAVVGETAEPNQPIMVLGDVGALWVVADLYEGDLAAVLDETKQGDVQAVARVKAFAEREFPGKVGLVSSTMDPKSRTVKVRVDVDNPDGLLRPGMFAQIDLLLSGPGTVTAVPRAAVLEDDGRFFIFQHHDGEYFVRRPVTVGRRWGDWIEIKAGVATGKRVAADGSFLLKSDVLRSKMGAGCAD
jgi:cobalt-zinc-cadmium efflux system membrane fusion protein